MASDPYIWARMFAQDAAGMRDNALNAHDNALMGVFREEAARQRPYATMPAELAAANFDRANQLPYTLAAEEREFDRWREQRRFQQQLDIEEAIAIANGGGIAAGGAAPPGFVNVNGRLIPMRQPNVPPAEEQ